MYLINQKKKELIFLEKEVPEIFGSSYILLILLIIFSAGLVILTAASWIQFNPSSIKVRKEKQLEAKRQAEQNQLVHITSETIVGV